MDLPDEELTGQLNLTTISPFFVNSCAVPIPQQLRSLSWRIAILDAP